MRTRQFWVRGVVGALLASLVALAPFARGATVVLRDETRVTGEVQGYDGAALTLEGGRTLPRESVKEVYFVSEGLEGREGRSSSGATTATAAELARLASWYARSEELQKRWPGSDGVILLDQEEQTIRADGTHAGTYHGVVHVLNDAQAKAYQRMTGWIEEGRSRHRFDDVTVYHRDGSVFRFDPARVTLTEQQEEARFFTRSKLAVYPVEGVERDAILDFTYTSETYNPFKANFFFPRWGFQSMQPTALSRYVLRLPKGKEFFWSLYNVGKDAPVVCDRLEGDDRVVELALEDVPPFIEEQGSVDYGDVAPGWRGSFFKDWKPIFEFLKELDAENAKATPEIASFTKKLVAKCTSDRERVAAVYHYLQDKIRYVAIKMGVESGWGGYPAKDTFRDQYGCCIDKALLFTAMLSTLDIWSTPIVLMTNTEAEVKWNLPQIGFNHAISMVRLDGKELFLDCTGSNNRFPTNSAMNQGVKCVNVFEERIQEVPVAAPEENGGQYEQKLDVRADGSVVASFKPTYRGAKEAGLRGYYKTVKENNRRRAMEAIIGSEHPAARLTSFEFYNLEALDEPFYFTIDYTLPDYLQTAGPLRIMTIPSLQIQFGETALKERKYPLKYMSSHQEKRTYQVSLPAELKLRFVPEDVRLSDPIASYSLTFKRVDERNLVITSDFQRSGRKVEPRAWTLYRDFLNRVAAATQQKLFFEVSK